MERYILLISSGTKASALVVVTLIEQQHLSVR